MRMVWLSLTGNDPKVHEEILSAGHCFPYKKGMTITMCHTNTIESRQFIMCFFRHAWLCADLTIIRVKENNFSRASCNFPGLRRKKKNDA